jgi:hypothetical protein
MIPEILRGRRLLVLVTALVLVQSVSRLALAQMDITQLIEVQIAQTENDIIQMMLYALGIAGVAFAYPFARGSRVGVYGMLAVSVTTIGFDIWGMTIQATAAMGLLIPVMIIAYIALNRDVFGGGGSVEIPGGVWN